MDVQAWSGTVGLEKMSCDSFKTFRYKRGRELQLAENYSSKIIARKWHNIPVAPNYSAAPVMIVM